MICTGCGNETSNKKYCGPVCQQKAQNIRNKKRFDEGFYVGKHIHLGTGSWPRRMLIERLGYKCASCGISEWNGKKITLEVNHKDGVATNNVMSNLEFLCPNCHSQTDNFRALNKVSVRTHRKKKIAPVAQW